MIARPNVGDRVLAKGEKGVVVSVLRAREVLCEMEDVEAQVFGDNQKSMLGHGWLSSFFRVGLVMDGSDVEWFDCHDIEEWVGENKS